MRYKNKNKNNELVALVKTLVDKNIITEQEIKTKKEELKNVRPKAK
jgi:hypothetical protein